MKQGFVKRVTKLLYFRGKPSDKFRFISVGGEGPGSHAPQIFSIPLVILCFEGRHPKQNTVACLKSNILTPKLFCTPKNVLAHEALWRFTQRLWIDQARSQVLRYGKENTS